VKDVPIFYFPYFLFPAKTTRETGLLFPRIGYSNRRGFQWEQPFFWAINKSSDATVALDVETAARVGVIGEYRYELSRQTHGNFTLAYYNEQIRGNNSAGTIAPDGSTDPAPENRFAIAGHHIQPFVAGSKLYLRVRGQRRHVQKEINTFAFGTRHGADLAQLAVHGVPCRDHQDGRRASSASTTSTIRIRSTRRSWRSKLPQLEAEHSIPLADGLAVGRVAGETTFSSASRDTRVCAAISPPSCSCRSTWVGC
jgi:hypothetical protein